MNKFVDLIAETMLLEKCLGHFSGITTNFNREISQRFPDSERTGQCASFLGGTYGFVSAYHVPEGQSDKKLRYLRNGHNKLIFLLENEDRISTAPKNKEEKEKFEKDSVWRGGIRLFDCWLVTTSGYHPVVDEAHSLNIGLVAQGFDRNETREKWMMDRALEFQNPWALALGSLLGQVPTINYAEALRWGQREIGEDFFVNKIKVKIASQILFEKLFFLYFSTKKVPGAFLPLDPSRARKSKTNSRQNFKKSVSDLRLAILLEKSSRKY